MISGSQQYAVAEGARSRSEAPATPGVFRVSPPPPSVSRGLAALARASAPYAERAPDLGHERYMSLTSTALLIKAAS